MASSTGTADTASTATAGCRTGLPGFAAGAAAEPAGAYVAAVAAVAAVATVAGRRVWRKLELKGGIGAGGAVIASGTGVRSGTAIAAVTAETAITAGTAPTAGTVCAIAAGTAVTAVTAGTVGTADSGTCGGGTTIATAAAAIPAPADASVSTCHTAVTARAGDRVAAVATVARIVYCKDGQRTGAHEHTAFTFLGFTFRARGARRKDGTGFTSFLPAVSTDALKRMGAEVRSWRLHRRTGHTLAELAAEINPIIRGWMQYYGTFYRSALHGLLSRINGYLLRWIRRKYERLRAFTKAKASWRRVTIACPVLFAHWSWCRSAW